MVSSNAVSDIEDEIDPRYADGASPERLTARAARQAARPLTIAEMIAGCKFSRVHPDIIEQNFPLAGPVADVSDMLTVSQEDLGGENMTTAEIEAAVDRQGYRTATLAELLAYAKARWNGKGLVVGLGSSWVHPGSLRLVPCLCGDVDGRKLNLHWVRPDHRWHEVFLFLVVRK